MSTSMLAAPVTSDLCARTKKGQPKPNWTGVTRAKTRSVPISRPGMMGVIRKAVKAAGRITDTIVEQ